MKKPSEGHELFRKNYRKNNSMGGGVRIGLRFYLSRINTKNIKIMIQDMACNDMANRVRNGRDSKEKK